MLNYGNDTELTYNMVCTYVRGVDLINQSINLYFTFTLNYNSKLNPRWCKVSGVQRKHSL